MARQKHTDDSALFGAIKFYAPPLKGKSSDVFQADAGFEQVEDEIVGNGIFCCREDVCP